MAVYIFTPSGIFYLPWRGHQIDGTNGIMCLLRKTLAKWCKQHCPSFHSCLIYFYNESKFDYSHACRLSQFATSDFNNYFVSNNVINQLLG